MAALHAQRIYQERDGAGRVQIAKRVQLSGPAIFPDFCAWSAEAGAVGRAVQLRQTTVIGYCGSLAAGGFGGLLPACGSPIKRKELKTSVSLWCSWVAAGSS